ncbi:hypothetical protein [uncultured Alistipes sp.]|uniref:hypothetical protein n=1 Tax=uncultured Alistipes sp. TaxID=538949 RepID=UPI00261CF11A|nr:hypothetical protein [uncultured Alistipes sp.]
MKKIFSILSCMLFLGTISAQDIIMKKDADEIEAKVTKVGRSDIEYKRWDNLDGPTYTIPVGEVFIIKYENGRTDKMSGYSARSQSGHARFVTDEIFPKYQGEVALAYGLGVGYASKVLNTDRIHFETVHGVRINPYLFAGLGLGFDYFYGLLNDYDGYYEEEDTMGVLPVFVDFKGYCPVSPKASIYLAWDLGAAVGVSGLAQGTEFYTSIGPGIDFGGSKGGPRGNFGIRFQYMGEGLNAVLFRVGCSF